MELRKVTRGMLFGQLELIGKGIFTLEGTKVKQAHTLAVKNALVHSPVLKSIDLHRNKRVPYESLNDLVEITEQQIEGLKMMYFDQGLDSWEGGCVERQFCEFVTAVVVNVCIVCVCCQGCSKTVGCATNHSSSSLCLTRPNCVKNAKKSTSDPCMLYQK